MVIGSGGREHALAWRLKKSPSVKAVHCVPGNPGINSVARCDPNIPQTPADYVPLAESLGADLIVVGPEAPLVQGVVDRFRNRGIPVVGPVSRNAELEGSKIVSKRLMERVGIPTARFRTVTSGTEAREALRAFQFPVVLKTDGLAGGKGVIIASTPQEADRALEVLTCPLVIEEFLQGEELSFIVLCDGKRAVPLEPSQDHKRVFDHDQGPNTGGMGAYSDSRLLNSEDRATILERIINPVMGATQFTGFLYAGLMMTAEGPKVLEFNVRLGDPETQPLMMRFDGDLGEAFMAAARGKLTEDLLRWSPDPATCVVLASAGYPGPFQVDKPITGLDQVEDAMVFQAGTKLKGDTLVTASGRVLGVTARGKDLKQSIECAYAAVENIHFEGMHFRRDIGAKGLTRYTE